ncbi:MAG: bis(5'-nucleosyl)-tetraphosphatase (symmetrical) YqeK [Firmicutes bacterium]|nr:bis(5'-nucleosyl)-tetraphosphatase (symmetrical) YqeK [Bacillota bacterium]
MTNSKPKMAIYGGSFDPVHKGHIDIIKNLCDCFDKVILVLAFVSPFKKIEETAPFDIRLKMLKGAVLEAIECKKSKEKIEICTYEIDKKTTSYTIDTVDFLIKKHPDFDPFLVVGADNLAGLNRWKSIGELTKKVTFFIVPRPLFKTQMPIGTKSSLAPFDGLSVSSSLLKASVAFLDYDCDKIDDLFLPSIKKIILKEGLYPFYQTAGKIFKNLGFKMQRIDHILGVIKYAAMLANIFDTDQAKAVLAALLHDIAKYTTLFQIKDTNLKLDKSIFDLPSPVQHAFIGAEAAKQLLKINDDDILNSIKYHTTARANMSILEKVVALSDYCEEGRIGDEYEIVRSLSVQNLDKAMAKMLEFKIKKLKQKNAVPHSLTIEAYEHYSIHLT